MRLRLLINGFKNSFTTHILPNKIIKKKKKTSILTLTCLKQWYGTLHRGNSKLSQSELPQLQLQHIFYTQIRKLHMGHICR